LTHSDYQRFIPAFVRLVEQHGKIRVGHRHGRAAVSDDDARRFGAGQQRARPSRLDHPWTGVQREPRGQDRPERQPDAGLNSLSIRDRHYTITAMATQAFESGGLRDEAGTVGAAGVAGAIVGGIIGGLRGALIGAAVGAGGVIAATEGKDVELPAGTILRVRFDAPVRVTTE
jgi:hypothetical protein